MNWQEVVGVIFLLATILQVGYYVLVFLKLTFFKEAVDKRSEEPVSVVICARNEADNLLGNLPAIFEQQHPNFEVVVVNDCSYDNTDDVLRAFERKYCNFKSVRLEENDRFSGGKKFAATLGIKAASNELLVFTDADCQPESEHWLSRMTSGFQADRSIVLGYGAFKREPGLLNKLIRFDAFMIGLQYLSFALSGMPYMGVGRNLAYRKSTFFANKGFASHRNIPSGDDDLFINEVIEPKKFSLVLADARTVSAAKKTFAEWWTQKRRHISTGKFYKPVNRVVLGMFYLSVWFYWVSFFTLLFVYPHPEWVLAVFGFRFLLQLLTFKRSMDQLGERDLIWSFPILELFLLLVYPILGLSNLLFKRKKWKS